MGDFHLALDLTAASIGTHYVSVNLTDASLGSKTVTFVIAKPFLASVRHVQPTDINVEAYPNPATSEINVVYDPATAVKTIAVYNVIGKVAMAYRPTVSNGASLNLNNLPGGIYFLRLFNDAGEIIATKKFSKQ
jgi:hypothetical protein